MPNIKNTDKMLDDLLKRMLDGISIDNKMIRETKSAVKHSQIQILVKFLWNF